MLGGRYLPAEDVGIGPDAVKEIASETPHVLGVDEGDAGAADPSPLTALGVFSAMIEMMRRVQDRAGLAGSRVAIQGLGGVGGNLARLVHDAGGTLVVADLDPQRAAAAAEDFGAQVVPVETIHTVSADVSGRALIEKRVAYAPDFVVNAGGVMWTSAPITGLSRKEVEARVRAIDRTLGTILDAQAPDETAQDAAIRYARGLLARA